MPVARITVTAVSDEGDNVIVWGRPEHTPDDTDPIGFAFQTKGQRADVGLAERASRLSRGTEAAIDYTSIAGDWNLAEDCLFPSAAHIGTYALPDTAEWAAHIAGYALPASESRRASPFFADQPGGAAIPR